MTTQLNAPRLPGWMPLAQFAEEKGVSPAAVHKMAASGLFTTLHNAGYGRPYYLISEDEARALLPPRYVTITRWTMTEIEVRRAIAWCLETPHGHTTFTTEVGRFSPDLAAWASAGYEGVPRPAKRKVPRKDQIAAYLALKLQEADLG